MIEDISKNPMPEEFVELVEVDVTKRSFSMHGSLGTEKTVTCDSTDQFMSVLDVVREAHDQTATDIVYV